MKNALRETLYVKNFAERVVKYLQKEGILPLDEKAVDSAREVIAEEFAREVDRIDDNYHWGPGWD